MFENRTSKEIRIAHTVLVSNTFKKIDGRGGQQELIHGCMGLMGEVGELIDAVKKNVYYGKMLDLSNVTEELGDIEYYLEAIRQNLKLIREDTLEQNIQKLEKRYPGQVFTEQAAQERADKVAEGLIANTVQAAQDKTGLNAFPGRTVNQHKPFTAEHRDFLDDSRREKYLKDREL